jgi:hypothetical protein
MNQTKTNKRSFNGKKNEGKKSFRPTGPKARVINLRAKNYHGDTLTEHAIQEVKRFYSVIDALRLGNYKTGFNTYQHGLVVVDGFTINRIADGGFVKVTGVLFGLLKGEDYLRLAGSKGEPALGDYVQALFIKDGHILIADGDETKVKLTKFKADEASKELTFTYQGLEAFVAQFVGELFALDLLPQFAKKEEAKAAAKSSDKHPRASAPKELRTVTAKQTPPAAASTEPTAMGQAFKDFQAGRPPKKTSVPLPEAEQSAHDESFALQA